MKVTMAYTTTAHIPKRKSTEHTVKVCDAVLAIYAKVA